MSLLPKIDGHRRYPLKRETRLRNKSTKPTSIKQARRRGAIGTAKLDHALAIPPEFLHRPILRPAHQSGRFLSFHYVRSRFDVGSEHHCFTQSQGLKFCYNFIKRSTGGRCFQIYRRNDHRRHSRAARRLRRSGIVRRQRPKYPAAP